MGYSPAEMDRQYNARAAVPDSEHQLREYTDLSAQAWSRVDGWQSVPYGDHPDEILDIFPAPGSAAAPCFFFIHGGYWRALSKDDASFIAPAFTSAGAMVVTINYSLAPAVTLSHILDQCRRALAWTWKNIAHYGGDPARIHVSGHSAGGQLAGMLLADGWQSDLGLPDSVVHSASPISGLFDLRPLIGTHVNAWTQLDERTAIALSPQFHLPQRGRPLLVAWGEHETDEFKRQSRAYGQAWLDAGYPATLLEVAGASHFNVLMALRKVESAISRHILHSMGLGGRAN
ncbi:alpha/beta hydrolase fold domain-containing protein [Pusillimonas sp. TS35]|nr:alpha/beta hydrolase [Paracandidimonas lactea]MYN12758.1 alpha/beta hydrolase fold domain-containing protein [Pusillimonas sp. TS35]